MAFSAQDFGATFQDFMRQMSAQSPKEEPVFLRKLREHFGTSPAELPIISDSVPDHDHPNLQLAIERFLSEKARSSQVLGVISENAYFGLTLSDLVAPGNGGLMRGGGVSEGPVKHVNVSLSEGRTLSCIQRGLLLLEDGEQRLAVLIQGPAKERHYHKATIEVMARERSAAERFLGWLHHAMRERSVYRGHVLSLSEERMMGHLQISFHELPKVDRDGIILPEEVLEQIERQTIRFSERSERLRAAGRHLKRGLLLHGPPGTGKTLTAMYTAGAIQDRTVLLLTGRGLGMIQQSCALARALQPSIVILEDVDLVAEERTRRDAGCASPLLFELLNEMDGLADDADILFLLTTNRPDILEPALAARPGRIDQAIEVPLPDAKCRERLIELYSRGMSVEVADLQTIIQRTDGASAAFIRELMRRAALFAADDGEELVVRDTHLDAALHELMIQGGSLTRNLLGFRPSGAR